MQVPGFPSLLCQGQGHHLVILKTSVPERNQFPGVGEMTDRWKEEKEEHTGTEGLYGTVTWPRNPITASTILQPAV